MRHWLLRLLTVLLMFAPLRGALAQAGSGPCEAAITAAEAEQGIPPGLLAAIAMVESGGAGQPPWPWTINAEGDGRHFATRAEAIRAVVELQAAGVDSIDVGCLQVNLAHHPLAFGSLPDAFDPVPNARYAAQFLSRLATELGNWTLAVGAYHSRTEQLATPYRSRVLAAWSAPQRAPVRPRLARRWMLEPPDWLRLARGGVRPSLPPPTLHWPAADSPSLSTCRWHGVGGCDQSPFMTVSVLRRALAPAATAPILVDNE